MLFLPYDNHIIEQKRPIVSKTHHYVFTLPSLVERFLSMLHMRCKTKCNTTLLLRLHGYFSKNSNDIALIRVAKIDLQHLRKGGKNTFA